MKQKLSVFLWLCLWSTLSPAGDLISQAEAYFDQLTSLQARFEQKVENSQLGGQDYRQGVLYIKKPGRFRWDYEAPYEQQITSDGKKIWIYDKDLEQVTVRLLDNSVGNTPAVLLSEQQALNKTFNLKELPPADGLLRLRLTPKQQDTSFTEIVLSFENQELKQMAMQDSLGQRTLLIFSQVQKNRKLKNTLFEFEPPKGVDVFEAGE
ncbi:MAG: outer membrane lipoprotein chaperone LolA [Gammaproteobacteria bacterium]|nr:outer membrane lipoprotein chaperone LolA [Gammaproteobacteria bacterium]